MTGAAESMSPFFSPYNPDLIPVAAPDDYSGQTQLTKLHVSYLHDIASGVNAALQQVEAAARELPADVNEQAVLCEQLNFPEASVGRHIDGRGRATWRYSLPVEVEDIWAGSQPHIQTNVVAYSREELAPQSDAAEVLKILAGKQAYEDFFESLQPRISMVSERPVVLGQHGEPVSGGFSYEAPLTARGLREQFARNMLKDSGILHATVTLAAPFNYRSDKQFPIANFTAPLRADAQGELTDEQALTRRRVLYSLMSQSVPLATMWA